MRKKGKEKEKERGERDRKDGKRARWQRGKENATVGYWIIYGTSNSIGKGIWEEIQKKKRKIKKSIRKERRCGKKNGI